MDLKNLQPTLKTVQRVKVGNRIEAVEFVLRFLAMDEVYDLVSVNGRQSRMSEVIREGLVRAIVGWDLTEDGKPLACTEEQKRRVLPFLCGLMVEGGVQGENGMKGLPDGENEAPTVQKTLAWTLVEMAGDPENFLKN